MNERKQFKDRLDSLQKAHDDLTRLIKSATLELERRTRDRESLTGVIKRQINQKDGLKKRRIKVVSLKEYKTLLIAIKVNRDNLQGLSELTRRIQRDIKNHTKQLKEVEYGIKETQKRLEDTPEVAVVLPFRRVS